MGLEMQERGDEEAQEWIRNTKTHLINSYEKLLVQKLSIILTNISIYLQGLNGHIL